MKSTVKFTKITHKMADNKVQGIKEEVAEYSKGIDIDELDVVRKASNIDKSILEEGSRTVVKYVSTRTVDYSGDVVVPKGISFKQFVKGGAPVFYGHNYSLPQIAKDESIIADEWGLKVKQRYADTGEGTIANVLWNLTQQGMNTQSSVGILPLEVIRIGDPSFKATVNELKDKWPEFKKTAKNCVRIIMKSILFEHSDVGLGDNTDTEVLAVSKNFSKAGAGEVLLKQLGLPAIEEEEVKVVEKEVKVVEKEVKVVDVVEKAISKITLVRKPEVVKLIAAPGIGNGEVKQMVIDEIRRKMGRLV